MDLSFLYKRYVSSVVSISSGNGSSFSTSSGFLISPIHIVTCCHCVCNNSGKQESIIKVFVDIPGGKIMDVKVLGVDGTLDVAVLELPYPVYTTVCKWATKMPEEGDQFMMIGTPQGDMQSVSSGYIRDTKFYGTSTLPPIMESLLLDGSTIGGNSGGPVFNRDGEVIGIAAYGYNRTDGGTMNGAIPFKLAQPIVEDIIQRRKDFVFGSLGIKVTPLYISDAIFLGHDKVQGYIVLTKGLLSDGDIILSVTLNGKKYDVGQCNSQSCIFSLIHMNPGKKVELEILSFGQRKTITVTILSRTNRIPQNGVL